MSESLYYANAAYITEYKLVESITVKLSKYYIF